MTLGEWLTYQPPKVSGKPGFSLAAPAAGRPATPKTRPGGPLTPDIPGRLSSPAGTPLPGEGAWRVLASVHGVPAVYGTYLRPDRTRTSSVTGIASMDQRLLRFQLHPGAEDPGPLRQGGWNAPRA